MCPCKSLRLVSGTHHHFCQFDGLLDQLMHAALLRPVQGLCGGVSPVLRKVAVRAL